MLRAVVDADPAAVNGFRELFRSAAERLRARLAEPIRDTDDW